MMRWIENYDATLSLEKYAVQGYRLGDDAWYGEDGMADYASTYLMNEWMLEISSWYLIGKRQYAGSASPVRMKCVFKDREQANKIWKVIKDSEPDYETLAGMGFVRVA